MELRRVFSILMLTMAAAVAQGAWVSIDSDQAGLPIQMEIQSEAANSWLIELSVPGITIEPVTTPEGAFDLIGIADCQIASLEGDPDLPVFGRFIALQHDGNPELEILSEEWIEVDGSYAVSFNDEGQRGAERALDNLTRDEYLPTATYTLSPRQIMGGVSLAALNIRPVQYNPGQQRVRVLRNISLRIRENGSAIPVNRPITETTASVLRPVVANWGTLGLDEIVVRGTYLIIINDNALKTTLNNFATWHNRKGHKVEWGGPDEISTWTTAGIKTYIQQRYNNANPPLEYVCIMGDAALVPAWSSPADNDWQYARLDGNDYIPDVAIGRISYNTVASELVPQINKILSYERSPMPANNGTRANWYKSGGVVGDYYNASYISTIQTSKWVRQRMLEAGYSSSSIDTLYWTTYHGQVPGSTMQASLNAGGTLWTYRGWLAMNQFSETHANNLTNTGYPPFILTLTCSTNDFASYDDLAECLMLPANNTSGGAIGVIGMSSSSTHTRTNNILLCGAVQGLMRESIYTTGGCLGRAQLELYLNYSHDASALNSIGYTNLMGDPATDVFTDTPDTLFVNNPSTLPIGTNYLTLTVTDLASQPVAGAYVNLVKGTEVYVGDWTDAAGQVTLNFATTSAESLYVTASKHNYRPAMNRAWVSTATRFVSPATSSFSPVEPGQVVQLSLGLKNWGSSSAGSVEATLTSSDTYITGIGDNYESYGTIAAGATVNRSNAFTFTVSSYAPAGHALQLLLTVTDNLANSWPSILPITVTNGDFEYSSHTLTGVGDGVLDPGESGQIWLQLLNVGSRATPSNLTGYLSCENSAIAITDNIGVFTSATAGGSCNNSANTFALTATANAYPGERIPLMCTFPLTSGFADTVRFSITIGSVASNAPTPPDEYGYWAFDNTDVNYDKHPTYAWVEIDPRQGGPGTVVPLTDNGEMEDASTVVSLPFTFRYYGEDYDDITICTNGWLAMGADQAEITDFRNYTIPSSIGPSRMIAPLWDDLRVPPESVALTGGNHSLQPTDALVDEGRIIALKTEIDVIEGRLMNADSENDPACEAMKIRLQRLYDDLGVVPLSDRRPQSLDQGGETCETATVISGEPLHLTGTLGATDDCVYGPHPYNDVFYRYTVPSSGTYQIDMCSSAGDTYLRFWLAGTCCEGNTTYNDDSCGDLDPLIELPLIGGQVIYIECGLWSGTPGSYNLNIQRVGSGPCENARIIPSLPATFDSTTTGAPAVYAPTLCGSGNSPDVFYQYTPTENVTVDISTCLGTTNYDSKLAVFRDGVEIACADDICSGPNYANSWLAKIENVLMEAGHTYCIQVTGYGSGSSGNYTLFVGPYVPPTPGGIYTYHDAANHQFIIAWSNVFKWRGGTSFSDETFQVILSEPGYPATPTGDGEILFQYQVVNNTPDASYSNDYATVGIENVNQTDGVLYSYNNSSSPTIPGSAGLVNGRAILFTTAKFAPSTPLIPEKLTIQRNGSGVLLRWDAVTEDVNGNPLSNVQYAIYRGSAAGFTPGEGTYLTTVFDTSYQDDSISGTYQFYVVIAVTP